ncbi:hypothetical protein ACQU0X_23920 [Pseudovibrio ascidiaceicola]|uniref:hypothetical protein n=1 Tax=Pseudovibrio ascidiaceicola TaxID=285279 RepID=UPI003D35FC6E
MSEAKKDTQRARNAALAIFDGRDPAQDISGVLMTLEHTVCAVLLQMFDGDEIKASLMLQQGLCPSAVQRLVADLPNQPPIDSSIDGVRESISKGARRAPRSFKV